MLGSLSNIEVRETRQRTLARWDFCLIEGCVKLGRERSWVGICV